MEAPILFGKYELLERINAGGMAEVVKARDTTMENGPAVALKRILPHLAEDQQFVAMFMDEARLLSGLDHEHIVRTLEVGVADGVAYMALEFVDGKDARMLFQRARELGWGLPLPLACYIIARVCEGLHYAHERCSADGRPLGLVHRDVSLQNLLLSYAGEVKVADFGIAMSVQNEARTQSGLVKGKFGYMSPEQIGRKPLDRRTDVFSAGICLYELLTGERLFSGDNEYEAAKRVNDAQIVPPRAINADIPQDLEALLMRALTRLPKDRFATAGEMAAALHAFMVRNDCEVIPEDLRTYLRHVFGPASEPDFDDAQTRQEPIVEVGDDEIVLEPSRSALEITAASEPPTTIAPTSFIQRAEVKVYEGGLPAHGSGTPLRDGQAAIFGSTPGALPAFSMELGSETPPHGGMPVSDTPGLQSRQDAPGGAAAVPSSRFGGEGAACRGPIALGGTYTVMPQARSISGDRLLSDVEAQALRTPFARLFSPASPQRKQPSASDLLASSGAARPRRRRFRSRAILSAVLLLLGVALLAFFRHVPALRYPAFIGSAAACAAWSRGCDVPGGPGLPEGRDRL